jgi:hypothetical protein
LLWLTLVVALILGWIIENRRMRNEFDQQIRNYAKQIESLKEEALDEKVQAELWQAKLKLKIMGTLDDEIEPTNTSSKKNQTSKRPKDQNFPLPALRPSTG